MERKIITFTQKKYMNIDYVFLVFKYDSKIINLVRKVPGARWSIVHKAWLFKDTIENHCIFSELIEKEKEIEISGVGLGKPLNRTAYDPDKKLLVINFKKYLVQKRYSNKTIVSYLNALTNFLNWFDKPIQEATNSDIQDYNHEEIVQKHYSNSHQNIVISALKIFFEKVELRVINVDDIERPKREKNLPVVLNKEEVKSLLESSRNTKHKTMLSLIYACGLRRSELLNLKPVDVDSESGQLLIRHGKGGKDRMVMISDVIIDMLREYYKQYRPQVWLFEGAYPGKQYSETSLQKVFKAAMESTGIKKPATLHSLRHSYATHLMNAGTDCRLIQELLGHSSIKTTEIYTHVSTKALKNIRSPFDDLYK